MPSLRPVFNRVFLVGNLTKDPERVRRSPSGMAVTYFRLALNTKTRTIRGELLEEKCFVNVSVWGLQAEKVAAALSKGSQVLVSGRLWSEDWEKDDRKQNRLSVVGESVVLIGASRQRAEAAVETGGRKGGAEVAAGE
jgi:single-strand DNA-binding protein